MKLYHLTPEQTLHLQSKLQQFGIELINFDFTDPSVDQRAIRAHAYLRGKLDLLKEILADEHADPSQPQE